MKAQIIFLALLFITCFNVKQVSPQGLAKIVDQCTVDLLFYFLDPSKVAGIDTAFFPGKTGYTKILDVTVFDLRNPNITLMTQWILATRRFYIDLPDAFLDLSSLRAIQIERQPLVLNIGSDFNDTSCPNTSNIFQTKIINLLFMLPDRIVLQSAKDGIKMYPDSLCLLDDDGNYVSCYSFSDNDVVLVTGIGWQLSTYLLILACVFVFVGLVWTIYRRGSFFKWYMQTIAEHPIKGKHEFEFNLRFQTTETMLSYRITDKDMLKGVPDWNYIGWVVLTPLIPITFYIALLLTFISTQTSESDLNVGYILIAIYLAVWVWWFAFAVIQPCPWKMGPATFAKEVPSPGLCNTNYRLSLRFPSLVLHIVSLAPIFFSVCWILLGLFLDPDTAIAQLTLYITDLIYLILTIQRMIQFNMARLDLKIYIANDWLNQFNKAFVYRYLKTYDIKSKDSVINDKVKLLGVYLLQLDEDSAWQEKRERAKKTARKISTPDAYNPDVEAQFNEITLDENDPRCFAPMCCAKVGSYSEVSTLELQELHKFTDEEIQVFLGEYVDYPDHTFRQSIDNAIAYPDQILVYKRIKQLIKDLELPVNFDWNKDSIPISEANCFSYFYTLLSFCTPQKKKELKDAIQQFEDQIFTKAFDVIWKNGMSAAHAVYNLLFAILLIALLQTFLILGLLNFRSNAGFFVILEAVVIGLSGVVSRVLTLKKDTGKLDSNGKLVDSFLAVIKSHLPNIKLPRFIKEIEANISTE